MNANPYAPPVAGITAAERSTLVDRLRGLARGRAADPAWARPALAGSVLLAAVLFIVNLTVSGYANTYYSAAALAASKSWSAWFFGSFDAATFITVDKPPFALWAMGLSVRLFGLSSWSILLPEALAGVATVAILFVAVRRSFGPVAATIAAVVMALTPAAVLIFRFDNPDAILTLLLVAAAWAVLRGLDDGRVRWLVLAGGLVGCAFLTKYLQAYLVLPAFAVTYAVAGRGGLRRRAIALLVSAVAVLVASGWWVAIVQVIPAAARPFFGGSSDGTVLDLIFGYDGLGRIFGGSANGGGSGGGGFAGAPGLLRLFNDEFGGQVGWFLPLALVGLVAGPILRARAARTDARRAGYVLWGGWFLVTAGVFSLMSGIIHPYYAVALAPAIAALVGAGVVDLWALRTRSRFGGVVLAAALVLTGWWAGQLLARTPHFAPGVALVVPGVALLTALAVAMPYRPDRQRLTTVALGLAFAALLVGPAAYALDTMETAYSGGDPLAGPAVTSAGGPGGGAGGQAATDTTLVDYLVANRGGATWIVAVDSSMSAGSIELASGEPVMAMGGFNGSDPAPTLEQFQALVASGQVRYLLVGGAAGGPTGAFAGGPPSGVPGAGGGPTGTGAGPGGAGAAGPGGRDSSTISAIDTWAASVGTVVATGSTGGGTLYDLSAYSGS